MCKYCEGKYKDKEPLMYKNNSDYAIKINSCNYLEENRVGGQKESIYGIKINYCPMCGRKLENIKDKGYTIKNKSLLLGGKIW